MNAVPADGFRAVLVHINFRNPQYNEELQEFVQLAESSGLAPHDTITGRRDKPDAKYFAGSGKVEQIKQAVHGPATGGNTTGSNTGNGTGAKTKGANTGNAIDVVIFNHNLSPAQERNLEKEIHCRVLDRVGLILDIFSQRARSYEGKLQVELAQLQHLSTRLVRGWSHLERQKGGIGLRGPGETQLETDRRLIGQRIKSIRSRLEKVKSRRHQGRRLRKRNHTPIVSLVGYTNTGKSTLFNQLTGAGVYAADKLFATLDPTIRKVELNRGFSMLLSDTVGFIRHIPHDLVESFHATLDEIRDADLLLHIIDINDEQPMRIDEVNHVIDELGATSIPQILVFNKIDQTAGSGVKISRPGGSAPRIWISAKTGEGLPELKALIYEQLTLDRDVHELHVPVYAGKLRSDLFQHGRVHEETVTGEGGWRIQVEMAPGILHRICRYHDIDAGQLMSWKL